MLEVQVQYGLPRAGWPAAGTLHRAARAAFRADVPAQVTLRLVDREEGAALNAAWRGRSGPTNVLSFPAPADFTAPAGEPRYLGDIVLCAPLLATEAQEQGKPLPAHFVHLVVHGMLHLQGWDHENSAEAEAMEAAEREILAGLGYRDPYA
jgi:probable rRNA maturation factor